MITHDGHVHTPFCPHGTRDSFSAYCEKAIELGLKGITFTEHAPLPKDFIDPTPQQDSAMKLDHLNEYITELEQLKQTYRGKLEILIGLEVDYIEGFEEETTAFLNDIGPRLDDSILSVHFLKLPRNYLCIDYSPETFQEAVQSLGSIEAVYHLYYKTVLQSVQADLGFYKPKRIGHITLVKKFQKKFPTKMTFSQEMSTLLTLINEKSYQLDYNGAGTLKPLCGEPYPNQEIINQAYKMGIHLVYGSDAHQASALMAGIDHLSPAVHFAKP